FSKIHTTQKKAHIILVGMKNIEMQLSSKQFLRVHRQYIVNLQHVEMVKQAEIQLSGNNTIPVSSAYKEALLSNLVGNNLLKRN
ncbi:MAG: LytTR family DNA-binding domain-containing protein, partial [Sediminibacterium sp.]|nr:LytTR family DNA-binding domain-containing protein [Sediminibacterium sp.]